MKTYFIITKCLAVNNATSSLCTKSGFSLNKNVVFGWYLCTWFGLQINLFNKHFEINLFKKHYIRDINKKNTWKQIKTNHRDFVWGWIYEYIAPFAIALPFESGDEQDDIWGANVTYGWNLHQNQFNQFNSVASSGSVTYFQ